MIRSNINLHPTPEKADDPYALSNRKRSRMRSHNTKSPIKIRSRFKSSPTPPRANRRRRSPSPKGSTRKIKLNRYRSRSPRRHRSPSARSRKQVWKPFSSFANWQDLTNTSRSEKQPQGQSEKTRGVNSSRIKGLENANKSLRENVEYFKSLAHANSYKYELMKAKAQDENRKRRTRNAEIKRLKMENAYSKNFNPFAMIQPQTSHTVTVCRISRMRCRLEAF